MTVKPVTMYTVLCDRCGADAFEGCEFTAWSDEEQAIDVVRETGDWLTTDEGQWCESCVIWDEKKDAVVPLPPEVAP